MAATYYGIVNKDGGVENSGSGNWSSAQRDDKAGLYTVTLSGGTSSPIPVVTVTSNDLTSYAQGKEFFINVTDIGTDDNGRYYFGVAINNKGGSLKASGFSFTAD